MQSFKNITVAELEAMLQRDRIRLVDVRARHGEAEPFGAGVPASHLLPQSAGFASNVSEVRARHGEAEPFGAGMPASHLLPQSAGFASNVSEVRARHGEAEPFGAGMPASHLLPQSAGFASNVSEVRTDAEMARGKIPQGEPLPLHLIPMLLNELDKTHPTVFYCRMGGRSAQAAAFVVANGFTDVYNLQGGIAAWMEAGLPVAA